jgi:hypothetical protein
MCTKSRDQAFSLSYAFMLACMNLLVIFASFLKFNSIIQITVNQHRHEIFVTLVFFMVISQKKIETLSIIHKQAHKLDKKSEK